VVPGSTVAARLVVAAADPQLCSALPTTWGEVQMVEVDGDLVADGECRFSEGRVRGDLLVPPGGRLDALSLDVHGDLRVAGEAQVYATRVHGAVVLDQAARVTVDQSSVVAGVTGSADVAAVRSSGVLGDVVVTATNAVRLSRSVVGGAVDVRGGRLLVHDTGIRGALTSVGATDVLVCRTTVRGDLTVTDVQGWSRVGQERQELCRTTVGGSVRVVDNPHSVVLDDLVVAGDVLCTGNTGPQLVVRTAALTVAGTRSGQCA
jgi:hypothetical protein